MCACGVYYHEYSQVYVSQNTQECQAEEATAIGEWGALSRKAEVT